MSLQAINELMKPCLPLCSSTYRPDGGTDCHPEYSRFPGSLAFMWQGNAEKHIAALEGGGSYEDI